VLAIGAGTATAWANGFFTALFTAHGIAGATRGEQLASAPFAVTHVSNTTWNTGRYVLPSSDSAETVATYFAENPTGGERDEGWLDGLGAVPVGSTTWEIELEGRRTDRVEIVDIEPVLDGGRCRDRLTGALIQQEDAGGDDKIPLWLDLDEPSPELRILDTETREPGAPFFDYKKITLANGENVQLVVEAHATTAYCEWILRVHFTADGRRAATDVRGPANRPFALTGEVRYPDYGDVFLSPLYCGNGRWTTVSGAKAEKVVARAERC